MLALDLIDRKIAALLMQDSTMPVARIADRVGLSQTPCRKRIQRFEADGVILRRVALVDPARIGLGLTAYAGITVPEQSADWRETFERAVQGMPEVIEAHRLSGSIDYLLRITVADLPAHDDFFRRLTDAVPIKAVATQFVPEQVKSGTAYPIDTLDRQERPMFYCPHDPHFAVLLATAAEEEDPYPAAVVSAVAGLAAIIPGIVILL